MPDDILQKKFSDGTYADSDIDDARGAFFRAEIDAGTLSSFLFSAALKKRAEGDAAEYEKLLQEATAASDAHAIMHAERFDEEDWGLRQAILQESGRQEEAEQAQQMGLKAARR